MTEKLPSAGFALTGDSVMEKRASPPEMHRRAFRDCVLAHAGIREYIKT